MRNLRFILYTIYFLSFISLPIYYGCDDTITNEQLDNVDIPDENVSYNDHILPLMMGKCAYSHCHSDEMRAGGLSLTSYIATTADYTIVTPYNPDNSRLVWAIEGTGVYPMPPIGYPVFTPDQIQGVRTWIEEGAKNN